MTAPKVKQAANYAHTLDEETQAVLSSVKSKNSKAVGWFIVSWTILLCLALAGIYRQNQLASQNKQHIDCIIKYSLASNTPELIGEKCNIGLN